MKDKLAGAKKAIAGFLIPVVPVVGDSVITNTWDAAHIWAIVVSALCGLGVYAIPNKQNT